MNKIKKYFEENKIKYVLFDMDTTLVDTSTYFTAKMHKVIYKSLLYVFPNLPRDERLNISKEIREICRSIHREKGTPLLVTELTFKGILKYLDMNNIKFKDKKKLELEIENQYKNFYHTCPKIFPKTLRILHKLNQLEIPVYVYSHAQIEWTQIKIDSIKNGYKKLYKDEINIPFFTTEISSTKDSIGWKQAAKYHNLDIKKTLVVGDSLTSDILPAIEAGYINLIYLSVNKDIPEINIENINFKIVDGIGNIFDNI